MDESQDKQEEETPGTPAEEGTNAKAPTTAEAKQAEKHEKFLQLSVPRMQKAEKAMDLLANLTGPNYYYTDEEAEKMMDHLQSCLDDLKKNFQKGKSSSEGFHW